MKKKQLPPETPKSERCDCDTPELIERIYMGAKGEFSFCKRCNRERRLSKEEVYGKE